MKTDLGGGYTRRKGLRTTAVMNGPREPHRYTTSVKPDMGYYFLNATLFAFAIEMNIREKRVADMLSVC